MENKSWENSYGYWQVTTEGDCEGRSTRTLGVFKGHYHDIAMALADKSCYSLRFKRIPEEQMELPKIQTRDKVQITFEDSIRVEHNVMIPSVQKAIGVCDIVVGPGMWDGHVTLSRKETEEMKRAKAMMKLKATLTPEEIKILGLE